MVKEKSTRNEGVNNWLEALQNPRSRVVKQFMVQFLNEKYGLHDDIISRISTCLITDKDIVAFGNLINDISAMSYSKAINECKEQFAKLGVNVNVKKNQTDSL